MENAKRNLRFSFFDFHFKLDGKVPFKGFRGKKASPEKSGEVHPKYRILKQFKTNLSINYRR